MHGILSLCRRVTFVSCQWEIKIFIVFWGYIFVDSSSSSAAFTVVAAVGVARFTITDSVLQFGDLGIFGVFFFFQFFIKLRVFFKILINNVLMFN